MDILKTLNDALWGPVMITAMLSAGVFMLVKLKWLPWRSLRRAFASVFKKSGGDEGEISPFQSLMTSLAATVGTGNVAGVASAMTLGGAGALFWMWVAAMLGLSLKFAECFMSVKYKKGNTGGPMFAMRFGIGGKTGKTLAFLFCVFGAGASFGIGNTVQANTAAEAVSDLFGISPVITGVLFAVITLIVLSRGIKSIGKVCGILVPVMAALYLLFGVVAIVSEAENLPAGIMNIMSGALSPGAVAGGSIGAAIRFGFERGVFSNESGLGSAGISAAAGGGTPESQGLINMAGAFFDTIIVCTVTGLVIAVSGELESGATGIVLTARAFSACIGDFGGYIVAVSSVLFAFSTLIGWEYYGEQCLCYIARGGEKAYRTIYSAFAFFGCVLPMAGVWQLSSCMNALMAVPNILCIILLSGKIAKECTLPKKML